MADEVISREQILQDLAEYDAAVQADAAVTTTAFTVASGAALLIGARAARAPRERLGV